MSYCRREPWDTWPRYVQVEQERDEWERVANRYRGEVERLESLVRTIRDVLAFCGPKTAADLIQAHLFAYDRKEYPCRKSSYSYPSSPSSLPFSSTWTAESGSGE